ncbi:uncharacterized protein LOC122876735 isoform X1 [Siniperca chuatsi]|uniref:uncharacterized protein LOC122876735 isoform X1 n=1 Tax=Siniperca chuatsi TaxID=119488 RepID=UPI001CE18BA7|nr:uncharacterized protein LOC122876735 isoform X1 [Siniperca chuatsi]
MAQASVTLNGWLNLQAEESESSTDTSTSETSSDTDSSSVLSEDVVLPDLWGHLDQYFQEGLSPSSSPQDDATGHASDGQNIIHSLEAARLTGGDPGDAIPSQNFEEQPPFHRESVSTTNQPLMAAERSRPQPADRDPGFSSGRNNRRTSSENPHLRSHGASSKGFPSARCKSICFLNCFTVHCETIQSRRINVIITQKGTQCTFLFSHFTS